MPISSGLPRCTGAPCTAGKARGDLDGADRVGRLHRPHRDDHRAVERARRRGRDRGAIHRHGGVAGHVAQLDAALDQRLLEGERAAQHEGDEIVAPMGAHVGRLVDQLAAPEHAVARQIGADVEIVGERRQPEIAGRRGRQQRAGLGVELAEAQEIAGKVARENGEVALHEARRQAGGLSLQHAACGSRAAPRGRSAERPQSARDIVASVMATPQSPRPTVGG